MRFSSLKQIKNLANKRVLMRVDFNVPVKNGQVKETYKIEKSLATIKYLLDNGARVILASHLGRPKGVEKDLSLKPVAKVLEKMLGEKVAFCECFPGNRCGECDRYRVSLLENIRFYPGEEANDKNFAKQLSALADVFVLDGFAVAHRDSASVTGVAKYLPTYAGLLLSEEIIGLSRVIEHPKKPLVVMLGGVKMETKIPVLKNLLKIASQILVGGGIANTYFWAKGHQVGASLVDKDFKKEILKICSNKKIILPVDVVVGDEKGKNVRVEIVDRKHVLNLKNNEAIYDIGPRTVGLFAKYLKSANTLVTNGALGYFEQPPYHHGTFALTRLLAARSRGKAFGVAGGGETVEILQKLNLMNEMDLVSTGGGAMLEFLSGKKLPGVQVVSKK